jgi:hypothetical protein
MSDDGDDREGYQFSNPRADVTRRSNSSVVRDPITEMMYDKAMNPPL